MKNEKLRPRPHNAVFAILGIVLFLLYLPLIVMLINSFLEHTNGQWLLTFRWYRDVFADVELVAAMERSIFVGITTGLISTIIGTAAAIAISKKIFRFRLGLEIMSFVSLIIPELVFALSLLSWFFILKIPLGLETVIAAHVTFCLSFVMLIVGGRISTLDSSLDEAARDLGASEFTILCSITLPLLAPAMLSSFVLSFLLSFDDFLITFYTNGAGADTLPIKLYAAIKMGITPKISALSSMMFLFSVVLILLTLRRKSIRDLL